MSTNNTSPDQRSVSGASDLERERFELEKGKAQFQQNIERDRFEFEKRQATIEEKRLELEKEKAELERRVVNRHLGTIITAIVSLAAVLVSGAQVVTAIITKRKELEITQLQKREEREALNAQHANETKLLKEKQDQEWNLNMARFFTDHKKEVFGAKGGERDAILRVLILTFPREIVDAVSLRDPQIAASITRTRKALEENPNGLESSFPGIGRVPYLPVGEGDVRNIKFLENWEAINITNVYIPQLVGVKSFPADGNIRFNRKAADALKAAFAEIDERGLTNRVLSWGEAYNPTLAKNKRYKLTKHAVGLAFDINEEWNHSRRPAPEGTPGSVLELVPILKAHGFDWNRAGDPAHFAWRGR